MNAIWRGWRLRPRPRSSISTTASRWPPGRASRGPGNRLSGCWPWAAWCPKRDMTLLAACRLLAEEGFGFHLTLAGEGPERQKLVRLIEKYGLGERVTLAGFVPTGRCPGCSTRPISSSCPSLITPSGDRDGIPNVVLEALVHEVRWWPRRSPASRRSSGRRKRVGWRRPRTRRPWPGGYVWPAPIPWRRGAGPGRSRPGGPGIRLGENYSRLKSLFGIMQMNTDLN